MPNEVDRINRHIGARLALLRDKLGLTQKEVGVILGVTQQQVRKYENGENRLSACALFALARHLHVEVPFFLRGLYPEAQSASGFSQDQAEYGTDAISDSSAHRLDVAFARVRSPTDRALVIALVETVARVRSA